MAPSLGSEGVHGGLLLIAWQIDSPGKILKTFGPVFFIDPLIRLF